MSDFSFSVEITYKTETQMTQGHGLPPILHSLLGAQVLTVVLKAPQMEPEICPPLPFLSVEASQTTKR